MRNLSIKVAIIALCIFGFFVAGLNSYAATGSLRISGDSFPDFSFQIPIGNLSIINSTEIVNGTAIALYISTLYKWGVAFAAVLAVLAFTYAGIVWLTAGGDQGRTTESKKIMGNAIIGLLLALGSYMFLATLGKDFVSFQPLTVKSVSPLVVALQQLQTIPPTTSIATRASTTTRTSLPASTDLPTFTAGCRLECTNRGTAQGKTLDPVVTESGGQYDCNCKEHSSGATCPEPNTQLSWQSSCSDICPVGGVIPPAQYVLGVKDNFSHTSNGTPFYCCSCITTLGGSSPTCGSKKDQQCCGIQGGDVVCQAGLYPVKKTTYKTENKCQCEEGKSGAVCNAETGVGCAPNLTCKKNSGFLGVSFAAPEDGTCQ